MKWNLASMTLLALVLTMSCRVTNSETKDLDNLTRAKGEKLRRNFCGKNAPKVGTKERLERDAFYGYSEKVLGAWYQESKATKNTPYLPPQIFVVGNGKGKEQTKNTQILRAELNHTLNTIPMNLLLSFFGAGGRIVVTPNSAGICGGKIAKYTPEKRVFALEDRIPTLGQITTDEKGTIETANGPTDRLPQIRGCWVSIKDKPGVEIHLNNEVVKDETYSIREDKKSARSVRHATVRLFAFVFSELLAHTYLEDQSDVLDEKKSDQQKEEELKRTLGTKLDNGANGDKTALNKFAVKFDPTSKKLTFKEDKISLPPNNDFMEILSKIFSQVQADTKTLKTNERDLFHYQDFIKAALKDNNTKLKNALNHFAFADAFDSWYCHLTLRNKMAKDYKNTYIAFKEVAEGLEEISVKPEEDGASIWTKDRGMLLAAAGAWHSDIFYGVFGSHIQVGSPDKLGDSNVYTKQARGRFFRGGVVRRAFFRVGVGAVRVARFSWGVVRSGTRVGVIGTARVAAFGWRRVIRPAGRVVFYTAGAVVGTSSTIVAPRWTRYRSFVGRGQGPFARGFRAAGRFWTWNGRYYGTRIR